MELESSSNPLRRIHPLLLFGAAVAAITMVYFACSATTGLPMQRSNLSTQGPIGSFSIKHAPSITPSLNVSNETASDMIKELGTNSSPLPPPTSVTQTETVPAVEELQESQDVRLERVLKAAAMEDKTVILAPLNSAWAEPGSIIDLFLDSFRIGNGTLELLQHVIMICLDKEAYARCKSMHPHCFELDTGGVDFSGDNAFMSAKYLDLIWRRINLLRIVLEKGYNFIFTDADILWFRDPFPYFDREADFQVSCDHYIQDPTSLNNWANAGFKYVKSNNRSIELYNYWYSSREAHPGLHDQDVFNTIKYDQFISETGVQIRFLSSENFGGFCEPGMDLSKVVTMHANCCAGLSTKIHDLRVLLGDWKRYLSMDSQRRASRPYSWSLLQFYCL